MNISTIIEATKARIQENEYWHSYLKGWTNKSSSPYSVHLAVFVQPYLGYILEGKKTVESRFSVNRCAPYGRVKSGDVLLLKQTGGAILGVCQVSKAWTYHLDSKSWKEIRHDYTSALCAEDPGFWATRKNASYATLMRVRHVCSIEPIHIDKRDRRGWVVLDDLKELEKQAVMEYVI